MKKSTIIATCLLNSKFHPTLEDAEYRVMAEFHEEFPDKDFEAWNTDVMENRAKQEIERAAGSTMINVSLFIERIWDWE
jgi:hypothetical protein